MEATTTETGNLTIADVVRQYFPNADDEKVEFIVWTFTGYPSFWTGDPETCFRNQLKRLARCWELGRKMCVACGKMRFESQMASYDICKRCQKQMTENRLKWEREDNLI